MANLMALQICQMGQGMMVTYPVPGQLLNDMRIEIQEAQKNVKAAAELFDKFKSRRLE
jgi:lipoate-protein ligase B